MRRALGGTRQVPPRQEVQNGEGRTQRPQRRQPPGGVDSRAASLPLPGVELGLLPHTPQLGQATPQADSPNAHVEDDVAVFLEEVPISPLRDWHHPQVLGEAGAYDNAAGPSAHP